MTERQREFLDLIAVNFGNDSEVNMFPKPMSDAKFVELIGEYILGKDWYCSDPVSHEQVNVYRACAIIEKLRKIK